MSGHGNGSLPSFGPGSGNPVADIMWRGIVNAPHNLGGHEPGGLISPHEPNSYRYPYASAAHVDTFVSRHGNGHGKSDRFTGGILGVPYKLKNGVIAQFNGIKAFFKRLLVGGSDHGSGSGGGH